MKFDFCRWSGIDYLCSQEARLVEDYEGVAIMARYYVKMLVEFSGEIEADSEDEAIELAVYDKNCSYDGVYSIEAELTEEDSEEEDSEEE